MRKNVTGVLVSWQLGGHMLPDLVDTCSTTIVDDDVRMRGVLEVQVIDVLKVIWWEFVRKLEHRSYFSLSFPYLWTLSFAYPSLCFPFTYNLIDSISSPPCVHCGQFLNVGPLTNHGLIRTYLFSPLFCTWWLIQSLILLAMVGRTAQDSCTECIDGFLKAENCF